MSDDESEFDGFEAQMDPQARLTAIEDILTKTAEAQAQNGRDIAALNVAIIALAKVAQTTLDAARTTLDAVREHTTDPNAHT